MEVVIKLFPPLHSNEEEQLVKPADMLLSHGWMYPEGDNGYRGERILRFVASDKRKLATEAILNSKGKTLSKVLNTSNLSIRELQLDIDPAYGIGREFKKSLRL